jgi:hypothetical protein
MKILISFAVFAASLTFGLTSLAAEEGRDMNALFPKPQPNVALSQPPAKTELVSPSYYEKMSGATATLKWKESTDASVYHVQVATDPNYKWLVKEEHLYKGTSLELSGLEAGKHYFWRVAAVKPDNKAGDIAGPFAASMFETK